MTTFSGRAAKTGPPGWLDPAVPRSRLILALVVTLAISDLPQIVLQEALQIDASWWPWAVMAISALLWLGSRLLPALNPFERYLAVMFGVCLAIAALGAALASTFWTQLVPANLQPMIELLITRVVFAIVAVALVAWAMVLGASRPELYLAKGDLNAPTLTRRKDGYLRWRTFGPIALVLVVVLMLWFTFPRLPAQFDLGDALPFIGIGAVAALLNAFWEEVAFRAVPLSMLQRAVGPGAGVLILALWFGLGHFYGGIPSGVLGLLAAGLIAVLFGRAMIETRGLGWPVALHFGGDLVIYTILAIGSVA